MKHFFYYTGVTSFFLCLFTGISSTQALSTDTEEYWKWKNLRIKYEYQHFIINPFEMGFFDNTERDTPLNNEEKKEETFCLDSEFKTTKNQTAQISETIETSSLEDNIKKYLQEKIVPEINTTAEDVKIMRNETGDITFVGEGKYSIEIDIDVSIDLIVTALENQIELVNLAVKKTAPNVIVDNPVLKERGIETLISLGQSDFSGSSSARIHNVMNGASKLNGFIIPQGSEFSFNNTIGDIDAYTGYAKEMVILGDKVVPEYGGGICQVSSTAYRAAMLAGLPITERHFHSFAVGYYFPFGSDATVYQGFKDFRFINDSLGDILIQTYRQGNRLFFAYYGKNDKRTVKILGPKNSNFEEAPEDRVEYSVDIAPGKMQVLGNRVNGFDVNFARIVNPDLQKSTDPTLLQDTFTSKYQPRPYYVMYGLDPSQAIPISSSEIIRTVE